MTSLELESLVAIDVHVHVEQDSTATWRWTTSCSTPRRSTSRATRTTRPCPRSPRDYRALNMAAVVFTVDAELATGHPALSNEEIADARRRAPRRAHPVRLDRPGPRRRPASGWPAGWSRRTGCAGSSSTRRSRRSSPTTARHYPLYEELQSLGVPALFHTGQTGIGAGLPGGRGIKLRYSDPMLLDDVAADFPGLTIIMAHPSVPWQDAAIAVATHKANVYIDLSGWSPKYFPPQLVRAANTLLKTQGAVRLGLPAAAARALDRRLRAARDQGRGPAADHEGERDPRRSDCAVRNAGLGSWPERRLRISPDRDAIWFEGTTTSHGGLRRPRPPGRRRAGRRSASVAGDRVAWTGGNHPSALETLYACGQLGAIWVPVNARLAAPEARVRARATPARSVVVHGRDHGRAGRRAARPVARRPALGGRRAAVGRRRGLPPLRGAARRRRSGAARRAGRPRRPLPDHVHVRHHRAGPRARCSPTAT